MKTMMRTVSVAKPQQEIQIEDVPRPVPSDNQVLVKITACGLCHTDVHLMDGDFAEETCWPCHPGHEGIGIVVQLGKSVKHLTVGDRVGIPWIAETCGVCEYCISGRETLCPDQKNSGLQKSGCLAEYVVVHSAFATPIPAALSDEQAAPMMCAGLTSFKAIKESEARAGQWVAIIGASGGLGHLALQFAKIMGLRVIAVDCGEEKLAFCKLHGAEEVVDATTLKESTVQRVKDITDGKGVHSVICIAPSIAAANQSIDMLRRGGTFVMVSLPPGVMCVDIFSLVMKRITIRGSIVGTREDIREVLDIAARGLVKAEITSTVKVEELSPIVKDLREGKIQGRVVVQF